MNNDCDRNPLRTSLFAPLIPAPLHALFPLDIIAKMAYNCQLFGDDKEEHTVITPPQIALVVTNLVAVVGIVYYMSTVLGKRIDALDKRMDDLNVNMNARFSDMNARFSDMNARFSDMNVRFNELSHQIDTRIDDMSTNVNTRFDDLRTQMNREHDALSKKVDTLTHTVTAHITDQSIHQDPRV